MPPTDNPALATSIVIRTGSARQNRIPGGHQSAAPRGTFPNRSSRPPQPLTRAIRLHTRKRRPERGAVSPTPRPRRARTVLALGRGRRTNLAQIHRPGREPRHPGARFQVTLGRPGRSGGHTAAGPGPIRTTRFAAATLIGTGVFRAAVILCRAHSAGHLPVVRHVAVLTTKYNTFRRPKITNCSMREEEPPSRTLRSYVYWFPGDNMANPRRNLRMAVPGPGHPVIR
jgi:hypothetical protein